MCKTMEKTLTVDETSGPQNVQSQAHPLDKHLVGDQVLAASTVGNIRRIRDDNIWYSARTCCTDTAGASQCRPLPRHAEES